MSKRWKVTLLLLALGSLLVWGLRYAQPAPCPLKSLLLPDDMMPTKWKREWYVLPPALPTEGAQDALKVIFQRGRGMADHTIYRYRNGLLAFLFLRINREVFFPSVGWNWAELAGSQAWGWQGQEARIRCGAGNDPLLGDRCGAVIRYGPYLSDFSASMGEGLVSEAEFQATVLALDAQIAACLRQAGK